MTDTPSFEIALAEVEQILRALEDGTTTLEESLARYERGVELLRACYGHLSAAEARIAQLAGIDVDGKPVLQPFEHVASDSAAGNARKQNTRVKGKEDTGLY